MFDLEQLVGLSQFMWVRGQSKQNLVGMCRPKSTRAGSDRQCKERKKHGQ